jgi:hypothetical protein
MVENRIPSATRLQGTSAPSERVTPAPATTSIEFRALLDRLREQAAALERAADQPLRAEELSHAVSEAGASLSGALSIAEGLLEVYRSSRVTGSTSRPS